MPLSTSCYTHTPFTNGPTPSTRWCTGILGYHSEQTDAPPVAMELQVISGPHPLASHNCSSYSSAVELECSTPVIGERLVSNTSLWLPSNGSFYCANHIGGFASSCRRLESFWVKSPFWCLGTSWLLTVSSEVLWSLGGSRSTCPGVNGCPASSSWIRHYPGSLRSNSRSSNHLPLPPQWLATTFPVLHFLSTTDQAWHMASQLKIFPSVLCSYMCS